VSRPSHAHVRPHAALGHVWKALQLINTPGAFGRSGPLWGDLGEQGELANRAAGWWYGAEPIRAPQSGRARQNVTSGVGLPVADVGIDHRVRNVLVTGLSLDCVDVAVRLGHDRADRVTQDMLMETGRKGRNQATA
jgi:hypothetical protein